MTDQVAASLGQPDARVLEVPHPLGGTDVSTVCTWADAAVVQALHLFTRQPS